MTKALTYKDILKLRNELTPPPDLLLVPPQAGAMLRNQNPPIFGPSIIEHNMLEPVKKHDPTKNGGKASYHNRIQKKWNKRYGMKRSNACYAVDTSFLSPFTDLIA